ncbi:MAG: DUF433 domain-containing protein [Nakamurella sp.]
MTAADLLDRPTYLYAEVDRLIGCPAGTARRWINGYDRSGRHYEPILRQRTLTTEWATWGEFVEARMLSEFRDQRVPTARLRAAVERLQDEFGRYPLAHLSSYLAVESGDLVLEVLDTSAPEVVRTGQLILLAGRPVFDSATLGADASGKFVAVEVPVSGSFPSIRVNPDRMGGQPTFVGRRVAVLTIAGMVEAGENRADLAADFGLSLAQVDEAVAFSLVSSAVA